MMVTEVYIVSPRWFERYSMNVSDCVLFPISIVFCINLFFFRRVQVLLPEGSHAEVSLCVSIGQGRVVVLPSLGYLHVSFQLFWMWYP